MTKTVRDYLARCMEDPEFAEAYQELEAEYQADRKLILMSPEQIVDITIAQYSDKLCSICGHGFIWEELQEAVVTANGGKTIAHKRCWEGHDADDLKD